LAVDLPWLGQSNLRTNPNSKETGIFAVQHSSISLTHAGGSNQLREALQNAVTPQGFRITFMQF
jgi:hypothetical protein